MRLTKRLAVSAAAVLAGASALPGQLPENMTEANVMAAVDQHDIGTVEEFVAALPKLHKRHFMTLHQSESPAKALVDETHPRVVSWGADARFILAWITDASSEQVEFIRAAEDRWVAGLIDFSDSEPVLRHPAVCGDCHGALDRPIWGPKEFHGTASSTEGFNIAEGETLLREERLRTHVLTTTDPRLAPLERSGYSQPVRRAIEIKLEQLIDGRRIDNAASQAANWDFSALLSLRHGEILFRRARSRADYDGHALAVLTNDGPRTGDDEPWAGLFQEQDRVLDTLSGSGASVMGSSGGSSTHGGFYSGFGAGVWDVMTFLALYDAYERFPSVAALYRRTSNSGMFDSRRLNPEDRDIIEHRLLFPSGEATAEEELVAGYRPNDDGIAAPDPERGRTASGQFLRETGNLILFGKLNHRMNDRHSLTLRYNFTDYDRVSDYVGEESRRFVESHSLVGSLVSLVGNAGVNEFRFQYAYDHFDRSSHLPESALRAHFRIFSPAVGSFGKPWWLPVFNHERKFEVRERFSLLLGNHEVRAGFTLSHDTLNEYFVGNADGGYDFDTLEDFVAGDAARAVIWFGSKAKPNFRVAQQILGVYLQDSWSPNPRLTLNAGVRWDGTFNPGGIEHVLPEGRRIPDDLDNISPRGGLVWSLDSRSIVRAGGGIFHARTPTLLFSTAHSDTGVFPRFGNAILAPGDTGFVPLGQPIDNENPPAGIIPALSYFDPAFEDPRTERVNLGYEREIGRGLAVSVDLLAARSRFLQSNRDANVPAPHRDAFGRPVYSGERIDPAYGPVLVRAALGRSDYVAVTAAVVDVPWPPLSDHIEINMSSLLPRRSAGADSQRSQNCRSRHRSLAVASPDALRSRCDRCLWPPSDERRST